MQCVAEDGLVFAAMVVVECLEVGVKIIAKAAMNRGISNFIYVVYNNAFTTVLLLPFLILHRFRQGLPLHFHLFSRFIVLGILGSFLGHTLGHIGIRYSSPALAVTLMNLMPASTFLLAIIFRMEKFDIRRSSSQAKSLGTVLLIVGALIVILLKGPAILAYMPSSSDQSALLLSRQSNWILGGLVLAIACILGSAWHILQAATMKEFPEGITIIFFSLFFGSILSAIFAFVVEREPHAWVLQPVTGMAATIFAASIGSAAHFNILTWCLHKRGPVYTAMFKPLSVLISGITGIIFLGETLYLGSVIGAVTIILGFYIVMWGKAKEKVATTKEVDIHIEESLRSRAPLLLA